MRSDLPERKSKNYHFISGSGEVYVVANQNIFLNSEFTFDESNFVVAPKIGYEFNYVIFSFRLNNVFYYEFNKKIIDNRILIEAGLTIYGWGNLCYGYSIPTQSNEIKNINRHRVSLRLNFIDY